MKRKFCFLRVCALSLTLIFVSHCSANVFKRFSRFSDVLRKGSHWNSDSDSLGRLSPAAAYYDYTRRVADDNDAEESAGTVETVVAPQQLSMNNDAHISSGFSPVTFTSRVQLPEAPNKDTGYSYHRTTIPIHQSNNANHPHLTPVLLQPIIQYIIQLPSSAHKQPQFDQGANELEEIMTDDNMESESSTSNLSENLIEMMEEASKGEDSSSNNNEAKIQPVAQTESTDTKVQQETMDNLMSIIEHMNNVSDADVMVNNENPPTDSLKSSTENNVMLMYGAPESSSTQRSTTPEGSSNSYQYLEPYGQEYSNQPPPQNPRMTKFNSPNNPQGYYNSPNRNIIRNEFLKSNLRSLQPDPAETEEAINLFSHLSDQIFRDMNKQSFRSEVSNRNTAPRTNARNGRYQSSVMGNNPSSSYSSRQELSLLDPNYGESSAYYTSYSNQRPPLDSEIYHTLQTILRNK